MDLDTTPLRKAVGQLARGLEEANANPASELARDGVIQRFEYTYELCHKLLRRFLMLTEASPAQVETMSFVEMVKLGYERDLLSSGWEKWRDYRAARGATSHAYDARKAAKVFESIPGFLLDASDLLVRIEARLNLDP